MTENIQSIIILEKDIAYGNCKLVELEVNTLNREFAFSEYKKLERKMRRKGYVIDSLNTIMAARTTRFQCRFAPLDIT